MVIPSSRRYIIVCDDFNYHMDNRADVIANQFLNLLESAGILTTCSRWYNREISQLKCQQGKLERQWRQTRLTGHHTLLNKSL